MNEDTSSLLSRLIDEAEDQPSAPRESAAPTPPDGANPLGALLSNPDVISKLPQLMSAFGGLSGGTKAGGGHTHGNQHTALLCALKPYLNPERRRAADSILNFLRIEEVLRALPLNASAPKKEADNVQQGTEQ